MLYKKLSHSENLIMTLFWSSDHPLSSKEICDYFVSHGKNWKIQTVNSYLTRMIKKGVIQKIEPIPNQNSYFYKAIFSKDDYERNIANNLLEKHYDGSIFNFFAALTGKHNLSDEEKKEIEKLLK